jgi:dipeptidyl aminopeptidase/acylaminoacyl peptidase
VSLSLLGVNLNIGTGGTSGNGGSGSSGGGTTNRTPAPSDVVLPEPEAAFPGSILYAKAGNIWIQTGDTVRELTNTGTDSMPSWSPDGKTVYFIRTTDELAVAGLDRPAVQMTVPNP